MLSTLFAVGVIAGMVWLNLTDAALPTDDEAAAVQPRDAFSTSLTDKPSVEDTEFGHSSLQLGDRYLVAGNHELALEHYHAAAASLAPDESSVLLREAFCCELMGWYQQAGKKYYRSITNSSNHNHLLLATSGYARCLLTDGKPAEALELVADNMLRLNEFENVPAESRSWLSFLYASLNIPVAAHQTVNAQSLSNRAVVPDLTLPHEVVFDHSLIAPERFLDVVDQPCEKKSAVKIDPNVVSISILQRPADAADLISLSVSAQLQPIVSLAAQISTNAKLNLNVSPSATETLRHRSRTIQLEGASLSLILDALLLPFDVVWFQVGADIQVMTVQEVQESKGSEGALQAFRFDVADRALRSFELEFQSSEKRHAALLARGNLNLIRKRYDAAANRYQELELTLPKEEMLASLFFNQAKLQLLLNNHTEARRLLYLAIDQTVNSDLEASSYCLLSSSLLATLDTDSAITTARRAIATAVDSRQIRWATLNLARAYLLANNPFAANDALFRSRDAFSQGVKDNPSASRQKEVAALLGAFARFRGVSDQRQIQAERNRLLTSIAMLDDSAFESFSDCYVAARAYRELGFEDRAMDMMFLSLARPDIGQWQRQLMFELGQMQQGAGQAEQAIKTFEQLTNNVDRWRTLALERLVRIYAENGRIEQCIARCKLLWKADLSEEQKRTTLQILGHAYQRQGEHHTAALCFAGVLPDAL